MSAPATPQTIVDLVHRQARAWEANNFALAAGDWHADGELTSPAGEVPADAIAAEMQRLHEGFTDLVVKIHNIFASPAGDKVAIEWDWEITRRRDGARGLTHDAIVVDLIEGKISSWREYFDLGGSVEGSRETADGPGDLTSVDPVLRGEREPLWVPGDQIIDIKLDGAATGGEFMLLEVITEPGGGAPLHFHTREDETLIMIEGEVTVTVGGVSATVRPGDVVHFPRGVPHAFWNTGNDPSRGFGVATPAGTERFFREIGVAKTGTDRPAMVDPDGNAMTAAMERAGMIAL